MNAAIQFFIISINGISLKSINKILHVFFFSNSNAHLIVISSLSEMNHCLHLNLNELSNRH